MLKIKIFHLQYSFFCPWDSTAQGGRTTCLTPATPLKPAMYLKCLRKIIVTGGTICWQKYQPVHCHVLSPTEELTKLPKSLMCWLTCNKHRSSRGASTYVWFQTSATKWMRTTHFWVIMQGVVIIPTSKALKMGQIGCPKTSVRNHHYSLHNSPDKCSSHLLLHYLATGIYLLPNLILPIIVTQTCKKIMSTLSFLPSLYFQDHYKTTKCRSNSFQTPFTSNLVITWEGLTLLD